MGQMLPVHKVCADNVAPYNSKVPLAAVWNVLKEPATGMNGSLSPLLQVQKLLGASDAARTHKYTSRWPCQAV